jgi:hypothetical protein
MTPSSPSTARPPWQEHQLPYGLKLLVMLGAAVLLIIAIVTFFTTIATIGTITGRTAAASSTANSIGLVVSIGLFIGSVAGIVFLYRYLAAPTNFKPSYESVPAYVLGHPFEVRYGRAGLGRSLAGKGTVRFDAEGVLVEGYLTPSPIFQIAVLVLLTVLPLVLFGFGLGVIPALLIAYYVGRKKIAEPISYAAFRDLALKGSRVSFTQVEGVPRKLSFHVASVDGERLYRELGQRFPTAPSV